MNRRALLIGAAAALALVVLWYVVLWSPTGSKIDDAKERKRTADEQAAQLRSQIQRLKQSQSNQAQQQAKLTALRASIPDTPKLGEFLLDVNDAAVKSGIDFISVAPSVPAAAAAPTAAAATTATTVATAGDTTTTAPAGPAEIKLALQVQGGYFQVLDFLNRLDGLGRLVVTDSVNVTADNTPTARLTVALSARIFTRSIPPEFGGTATTTTAAGGTTTTTAAGGATTTTAAGATTTTGATR